MTGFVIITFKPSGFVGWAFYVTKLFDAIKAEGQKYDANYLNGKGDKALRVVLVVLACLFPLLPVNVVGLAFMQSKLNKLYQLQETAGV